MKKIRKYCRVTQIDVLIFSIDKPATVALPALNFEVESKKISNAKIKYFINDQSNFVHSSILFTKLHVLKLIGKKGPAIGNCVTNPAYRGQSIYPIVIHQIASDLLRSKKIKEVFIIVNTDNVSSIRGIEKAGFRLHSKVTAKRFLLFYFDVKISRS